MATFNCVVSWIQGERSGGLEASWVERDTREGGGCRWDGKTKRMGSDCFNFTPLGYQFLYLRVRKRALLLETGSELNVKFGF